MFSALLFFIIIVMFFVSAILIFLRDADDKNTLAIGLIVLILSCAASYRAMVFYEEGEVAQCSK